MAIRNGAPAIFGCVGPAFGGKLGGSFSARFSPRAAHGQRVLRRAGLLGARATWLRRRPTAARRGPRPRRRTSRRRTATGTAASTSRRALRMRTGRRCAAQARDGRHCRLLVPVTVGVFALAGMLRLAYLRRVKSTYPWWSPLYRFKQVWAGRCGLGWRGDCACSLLRRVCWFWRSGRWLRRR